MSGDLLFPSLCREGIEGWVCIGIPAAEEYTCDKQAVLLSWPSGMTALLPFGLLFNLQH